MILDVRVDQYTIWHFQYLTRHKKLNIGIDIELHKA